MLPDVRKQTSAEARRVAANVMWWWWWWGISVARDVRETVQYGERKAEFRPTTSIAVSSAYVYIKGNSSTLLGALETMGNRVLGAALP